MVLIGHENDFEPTTVIPREWCLTDLAPVKAARIKPSGGPLFRDLARETVIRTEKYGYQFDIDRFITESEIDGYEVGDDRVDASHSPERLALALVVQERVFGMKTSEEDTVISNTVWNFCEVTCGVPSHNVEGFDYCRRGEHKFRALGYVDSPILRIIIDASKQSRDHSSTAVGKASMLRARISTPRTEFKPLLEVASFFQDGCLRTIRSPEPKYLHYKAGGSDMPPLFGEYQNALTYLITFKGGGYDRIYGSCVRELRMSMLSSINEGIPAKLPVLCNIIREPLEHLSITYEEYLILLTDTQWCAALEEPLPIYEHGATTMFTATGENRLVRANVLVTKSDATKEHNNQVKLREQLFGPWDHQVFLSETAIKNCRRREKCVNAIRMDTALMNLLNREADRQDLTTAIGKYLSICCGVKMINEVDLYWLIDGGRHIKGFFTVDDIPRMESMFLRDDIDAPLSLKVGGIALDPLYNYKSALPKLTTIQCGLFMTTSSQQEWCETTAVRLRDEREALGGPLSSQDLLRVFNENTEFMKDDNPIVGQARLDTKGLSVMMGPRIIIFSFDHGLQRKMAQEVLLPVGLCHPLELVKVLPKGEIVSMSSIRGHEDSIRRQLNQQNAGLNISFVYFDFGNIEPQISKLTVLENADTGETSIMRRKPDYYTSKPYEEGRRYIQEHLVTEYGSGNVRIRWVFPPNPNSRSTIRKPRYRTTI
jgi:hypothetical protein